MTIINCTCGCEIFIMDELEADAWQCGACGKWFDFFAHEVKAPNRADFGTFFEPHE